MRVINIPSTSYYNSVSKSYKEIIGKEIPDEIEIDDKEINKFINKLSKAKSKEVFKRGKEILKEKQDRIEEKRKSKEKKERYIALLETKKLDSRYLDLGEIKGVWYYGKTLDNKPAIITSDREIHTIIKQDSQERKGEQVYINEIKKLFNYSGNIGEIADTWENDSIKEFIIKNPKIDKRGIFENVRDLILYFMDFGDDEHIADVQACWIIATYCYPLFYWFPHILFNAPRDSGKSKNAYIMMNLSFRGYDLGSSAGTTPAHLFRTIEDNRGTLVLDEFEKMDSESYRLVCQILNASCSRDSYVIRPVQIGKKWVSTKFPIFCPKIACNISGINPTSLTRFIAFSTLKTLNKEKSKRKPYRENEKKKFKPISPNFPYLFLLLSLSTTK